MPRVLHIPANRLSHDKFLSVNTITRLVAMDSDRGIGPQKSLGVGQEIAISDMGG